MLELLVQHPEVTFSVLLLIAAVMGFVTEQVVPGRTHRARLLEIHEDHARQRAEWETRRVALQEETERWTTMALKSLGHAESLEQAVTTPTKGRR